MIIFALDYTALLRNADLDAVDFQEQGKLLSPDPQQWYSLTKASEVLGVHPITVRRWADAGKLPHLRTPGGHRRFKATDLEDWLQGAQATSRAPRSEALIQQAVGFARQEMAAKRVAGEAWYLAFDGEIERQQMRDTGRRLYGLAIQFMGHRHNQEPVLHEARGIGEIYGRQCARRGIGLANTMRAMFFFRESLLQAVRPDWLLAAGSSNEEGWIYRQLCRFLDEVLFACLSSYEVTYRS